MGFEAGAAFCHLVLVLKSRRYRVNIEELPNHKVWPMTVYIVDIDASGSEINPNL